MLLHSSPSPDPAAWKLGIALNPISQKLYRIASMDRTTGATVIYELYMRTFIIKKRVNYFIQLEIVISNIGTVIYNNK